MLLRFAALIAACLLWSPVANAQPVTAPAPKYADAVKALQSFIEKEVEDKRLPALSIALIDDQNVVWARGFGFADLDKKKPATADTVYRVGSVSKLFTDIAIMQLVEQGKMSLDDPITKYLPEFQPKNPFNKPITLRMMMAHHSGLVREPPTGNYFDDKDPSLAHCVQSLNATTLVFEPGTTLKYSNAAIGTVGYVLEKTQKKPFADYVQEKVLDPLGLKKSSFKPTPAVTKDLAEALMWSYHGREFRAPTFELGMAPAGCMYSTVNDLARFVSVLLADGKGILKPETLKQMLTPQFAKKDEQRGFGIGFSIEKFDGQTLIGHGGAIYGFATDLAFLPDEKLGVAVIASRDVANPVVTRIAHTALRQMIAAKHGKTAPKIETANPLPAAEAKSLAGRYRSSKNEFDLVESNGRLWLFPSRGGFRVELRRLGDQLVTDDVLGVGTAIKPIDGKLIIGKEEYARVPIEKPAACPPHFLGLIGEYGWDHNVLYIFEKDGQLYANIEWFFIYPLKEITKDTYAFPDFGLYFGEKLIFQRDAAGKATEVVAASVVFKRRQLDGEDGKTFRITPLKPVAELRREALAAKPPDEKGDFRRAELVDVTTLDAGIKLDLRYASDNNFLSTPLYPPIAKAYLQKPAAEALVKVNAKLKEQGYGLLIHDAYRPWAVTKMFFEATPPKFRHFVADPSKGSRHNRGCAVDLTLYELKTGKPVEMVSGFDEFSDRSYPDYLGGTSLQRWRRDLLRRSMESEGFTVYEAEWWHYDYKDWQHYAIGNQTFEALEKK